MPPRPGKAWPSPRSWDMAATLLAGGQAAGSDDLVRSLLVRGAVGQGPGIELLTWLVEADLPDPEEVLADPEVLRPARTGRSCVRRTLLGGQRRRRQPDRRSDGNRAGSSSAAPPDHALDVAAAAARPLVRCRPAGAPVPTEVHLFTDLLHDAGLLD